MPSDDFLDAALAIGRRIVAEAVWQDGRCSWMGADVEPERHSQPEYRPVGPLLYDGTAGVGLFLAQLDAAAGDAALARTAAGALRHAVERARELPTDRRAGLHAGALGIAWAAGRAGALLRADELVAGARSLLEWSYSGAPARGCPDLVTGAAGSAAALLALSAALDDRRLVDTADAIGETLLATATVSRRGWSWRDPAHRRPHHLCGAAHGAGGIGWALLELFAATRNPRFAAGAGGAFSYERSWLDEASATWPDLRLPARRGVHRAGMTATWCYGEAGIALSRLRACDVLGDGPHQVDATIAVATTRRHVLARLPFAIDDLSLCHGAAGAADTLLSAGDTDTAVALGRVALERYGEHGDWPCGVYGTTPGLFRGLSGIGWFFLRLHDPAIPSPLVLPPGG